MRCAPDEQLPLSKRYQVAQDLKDINEKLKTLQELQAPIASVLPSSNENMEDVTTWTIPFLGLDYLLGDCYMNMSSSPLNRSESLRQAMFHWQAYLERLERLDCLSKQEQEQMHMLMDLSSKASDFEEMNLAPPVSRDVKIARHRTLHTAMDEQKRLQALQTRRHRLKLDENENFEGYDNEALAREIAVVIVCRVYKLQAIEGWSDALRELPLALRMAEHHRDRQQQSVHGKQTSTRNESSHSSVTEQRKPSKSGLQVTHITQNPATGQLQMQRENVQANVLRPHWNQPTMTLAELGDREVQAAISREEAQKQAEAARAGAPRRYEQLIKDGKEDNPDLVDSSAALDRQWDDFKDENPRGSGNKRANVGDRNF